MTGQIVILRPEPGASATAAKARILGLEPIIAPLFMVEALDWDAPPATDYDAVMMTSANAARLGGGQLAHYHRLPLFAVGSATAHAARAAGFSDVRSGTTDAPALVAEIAQTNIRRVLHLVGADHTPVTHTAVTISRRIVYAANPFEPAPQIPANTPILVHSARAGARLAACVAPTQKRRHIVIAISAAAAHGLGTGWNDVQIAAHPNDDALLAHAAKLCKPSPIKR